MILSVKNELKTLFDSVRFVVSSCPENSTKVSINRERTAGVIISLAGSVAAGRSFDFAGKLRIGAVYSFAPAAQNIYCVVEKLAVDFVTVINALVRKPIYAMHRKFAVLRQVISRRVLFKRQAVLAYAGGLRL